jgi:hypothetical protein
MLKRTQRGQLMKHIALFHISILVLVFGLTIGCTGKKPVSYVIVAVDQLSFADASCSEDRSEKTSGIAVLCNESVKWTHAYTTSLLSGPALASLMTGLHPIDSGFRKNNEFLSPQITTVGRLAHKKNYRTLFLSGGPPILKKTGLGIGFESFEDFLNIHQNPWLRTFKKNTDVFFDWLDDVSQESFFVVFYVPDLRFLSRPLVNSFGDPREKSFDSQFDEFDSTLFDMIDKIKKKGRWDSTHFLLVGLQGRNLYDRKVINPNMNLNSESSQVGFFWKPTQNKRDAPVSWAMDKNISLADIGVSLIESLGGTRPQGRLETATLIPSLSQPKSTFSSSRIHLIESSWSQWQLGAPMQYALIADEELYMHEQVPKVYRTLTDRLETTPLSGSIARSSIENFKKIADELKLETFVAPEIPKLSRWNFTYWDWLSERFENIKSATASTPWLNIPTGLRAWTARSLIESNDWKGLKSASEAWKTPQLLWLAHKNLGLPEIKSDPCLALVSTGLNANNLKSCSDTSLVEILSIQGNENRARRWERLLEEKMIQSSIIRMNRALSGIWDVQEDLDSVISRVEIYFRTPEHRAFFRNIDRRVNRSIQLQPTQPERL